MSYKNEVSEIKVETSQEKMWIEVIHARVEYEMAAYGTKRSCELTHAIWH